MIIQYPFYKSCYQLSQKLPLTLTTLTTFLPFHAQNAHCVMLNLPKLLQFVHKPWESVHASQ